jgi:hypothetical protein
MLLLPQIQVKEALVVITAAVTTLLGFALIVKQPLPHFGEVALWALR